MQLFVYKLFLLNIIIKNAPKRGEGVKKKNRQRATFAYAIIAAVVLNFCVRDGYRCVHHAIITGFFFF